MDSHASLCVPPTIAYKLVLYLFHQNEKKQKGKIFLKDYRSSIN